MNSTPTGTKSGRAQTALQISTTIAAVVAAVASLSAYIFPTRQDLNTWWQRTIHRYSVQIESPPDNANVGSQVDISGTASLPHDWDLIVLVQTPDELKYYIAGGGAVSVGDEGKWRLSGIQFGSIDPQERQNDLHKYYKIVALLADEKGLDEVRAGLLTEDGSMVRIPHHAALEFRRVLLTS